MRYPFCLDTAKIKKTSLDQQIRYASVAGFEYIGLWLEDIRAATSPGSSLKEIAKRKAQSSGALLSGRLA